MEPYRRIPQMGILFRNLNRSFFTVLLAAALLTMCSQQGFGEQRDLPENDYDSVEERRLQVRIIEAHDTLIEEKKALRAKETELLKLEKEIDLKLKSIDRQLTQMEQQKRELETLLTKKSEADQRKVRSLGQIYENMDPVLAAQALATLDSQLVADILAEIKPRSAARILNGFTTEKAAEVSRLFLTTPGQ